MLEQHADVALAVGIGPKHEHQVWTSVPGSASKHARTLTSHFFLLWDDVVVREKRNQTKGEPEDQKGGAAPFVLHPCFIRPTAMPLVAAMNGFELPTGDVAAMNASASRRITGLSLEESSSSCQQSDCGYESQVQSWFQEGDNGEAEGARELVN